MSVGNSSSNILAPMSWSLRSRSFGSPLVLRQTLATSSRIVAIFFSRFLIGSDSNCCTGFPGSRRTL